MGHHPFPFRSLLTTGWPGLSRFGLPVADDDGRHSQPPKPTQEEENTISQVSTWLVQNMIDSYRLTLLPAQFSSDRGNRKFPSIAPFFIPKNVPAALSFYRGRLARHRDARHQSNVSTLAEKAKSSQRSAIGGGSGGRGGGGCGGGGGGDGSGLEWALGCPLFRPGRAFET